MFDRKMYSIAMSNYKRVQTAGVKQKNRKERRGSKDRKRRSKGAGSRAAKHMTEGKKK